MPFLRLFRRKKPKPQTAKGTPVERFERCRWCLGESFYEGPSGGLSQNITCSTCGARYNIGLMPGGPVLIDILSGPTNEHYIVKPTEKEP
jgi:hypothetical protein